MEPNKKYYKYCQLTITIILLLFITACDGFETCYDAEDFSTNSEYDSFVVDSSANNCYYNEGKSYADNNTNSNPTYNCLGTSSLDKIGGDYDYIFKRNNNNVEKSSILCKSMDPLASTSDISIFSGSENVTETAKNTIFNKCLEYCVQKCDENPQQSSEWWTKANLKTETSYVGIKLKKDTSVTINATGSLTLSDVSVEQKAEFSKYFIDDINYNFSFDSDPISNFDIYVNKDGISNNMGNGASDILDISYMDFENFDQATVVDGTTKEGMYEFTKPHYNTVECEYYNDENEKKNSVYCSFRHKNSKISLGEDEISNLDNYYSRNYKTSVFADGDYYVYSNDIFNEIKTTSSNDNYGFDEEKLKMTGYDNCIKLYGSSDCSGYIWTKDNTIPIFDDNGNIATQKFFFKLKKASKIAVKYIGAEAADGCKYSVSEKYTNANKNYIESYENKYENLDLEKSKWIVLHDNSTNKNELIFDEFSTINSEIETEITLQTNNNEKCYAGIVIKIIPLKEFQVKQTGFMFFSVPSVVGGVHQEGKNIKYRIINPKAVTFNDGNDSANRINQATMKERFYEQANGSYSLVSNLSDFNTDSLDKPEVSNNNYFVRSGQIVRFDYSNFFNFDVNSIKPKRIEYNFDASDASSRSNLDYMIGLNVFIREKRPLFCYGKFRENINLEKFCSAENGDYQTINTNSDNNKQVCYINNPACNAPDDLVKKYRSLDYRKENCTAATTSSLEDKNNLSIYDLWDKVYTDYKYVKVSKTSCLSGYENLIGEIYKEAIKCRNSLAGKEYSVYYNNTNYIKESYTNLPSVNSPQDTNDTLDKKINYLISLFKTSKIEINLNTGTSSSGSNLSELINNDTSGSYKSNFYYYKNPCSSGNCQNDVTQCYDAANLKVSLKTALSCLKGSNSNTDNIGLSKLQSFDNSSKKGLIKNFLVNTAANKENGYSNIYYNNLIYPPNNSFLRILIINNLDNFTSIDDFSQKMRDGNGNVGKPFFKIILDKETIYKNGDRLAVFIGCNSKLSDYKNNEAINSKGILPVVKYKEDAGGIYTFDTSSLCKFDSSGKLVTLETGKIGMNLASSVFEKYNSEIDSLCEDNDPVFFFKIMDVDNDSSNNSGNYEVNIRAVNKTENTIIGYFKSFFNTILSFVDGSDVLLQVKNGEMVGCKNDSKICYIYNENYSDNNGDACSAGEANCYAACEEAELGCKSFPDGKGFAKNVYLNFINDPLFQFIAKMALALAITLYGFGYFLGLSNFTQSEIVTKLVRFCVIYFLISPSGWNFFDSFVIKFFKDGINSVLFLIASAFELDVSSELSVAVASENYSDKSVLFSTCFSNIELLFSAPVFNKMLGLAFSSWYGLIYLYLVLMTVINYIVGVFSAIVMYLTSQIYMSLVFCFFPLVLLFMFFEKTKKTFDNWLSQLIGFAGQQIFLIMTISFFNILINNYIRSVFSYRVCWLSIFNINIGGFPLGAISFWKIPSSSATRGTLNTVDENAPSFYSIMSFYIIGILMSKFVTGAAELGSSIFGGMNIGNGVAKTATDAMNKGTQFLDQKMKGVGGSFYKGMANRFLGGKAIEDYKNKQKEETEKRRNFMNSVNEKTDQKMKEEYGNLKVGSKEYNEARKVVQANVTKQELTKDGSIYGDELKKFKKKEFNKKENSGKSDEDVLGDFMRKKGLA